MEKTWAFITMFLVSLIDLPDYSKASSDVNVTKFEGISKDDLKALPAIQCKSAEIHPERPIQSCISENYPRGVFMVGYNETSCYLCYTNSAYSKMHLKDIKGVKWFARQGNKCEPLQGGEDEFSLSAYTPT